MGQINWKKSVTGNMEAAISLVTRALQREGFGVLTRIDLDKKFQEKLGKSVPPVVILGACAPGMAYEAYRINSDVASLLPCNVVIREVDQKTVSVEIVRPSAMMEMLADQRLSALVGAADTKMANVLKLVDRAFTSRNEQAENGAELRQLEEECWDREGRWGLCREENTIEETQKPA